MRVKNVNWSSVLYACPLGNPMRTYVQTKVQMTMEFTEVY